MRIRTFFTLLLLLGTAAAVVLLLLPNQQLLESKLAIGTFNLPVWGALVGALALGALGTLTMQLSGWGRVAWSRARRVISSRKRSSGLQLLAAARLARRQGQPQQALELMARAAEAAPDDPRVHIEHGDLLRAAGRQDDAAAAYERARRIDPSSSEATHALAMARLEARELDEARALFESLTKQTDERPLALRALIDLERHAGRWQRAEELYRQWHSVVGSKGVSEDERVLGLGIRTELARGKVKDSPRAAKNALRRVLKDEPRFLPARELLAEVTAEAGSVEEARQILLEGFEVCGDPLILEQIVELELKHDQPEVAISTLRGLIAARKHPAIARLVLGLLYMRLEMLDDAADQLDSLLESAVDTPWLAALLAEAEHRRGQHKRAASLLVQVAQVLEIADIPAGGTQPSWRGQRALGGPAEMPADAGGSGSGPFPSQASGPVYPTSLRTPDR